MVAHPSQIAALLEAARRKGWKVSTGPKTPKQLAGHFKARVGERLPAVRALPHVQLSAFANMYYQQAIQAYLVGLDLPCMAVCLMAVEAVLRDFIHDACSAVPHDRVDQAVMGELKNLELAKLAHCAKDLMLIDAGMHRHLTEEVIHFRNPVLHGNGHQLAKHAGGATFSAEATVANLDFTERGTERLTLDDRVMLAPLAQEVIARSSLPALRLVPDLHKHLAARLAQIALPATFPEKHTQAHRNAGRGRKSKAPSPEGTGQVA